MVQEDKKILRIALLLDSYCQPQWVKRIVDGICGSDFAEIVLIVRRDTPEPNFSGPLRKIFSRGGVLFWSLCSKFDDLAMSPYPDPFEQVDIDPTGMGWPILEVQPCRDGQEEDLADEDISRISSYNIDVALDFGQRPMGATQPGIARYGIWSPGITSNGARRGGPPGFWEVMGRETATEFTLRVMTGDGNPEKVLYRSYTSTDLLSIKGTRSKLYWKSAAALVRKLRDLFERGPLCLDGEHADSGRLPAVGPLRLRPTGAEMLAFLFKIGKRRLARRLLDSRRLEQWFLAFKLSEPEGPDSTIENLNYMEPLTGRFWADPFPIESEGTYYIFMEEFLYSIMKAHISVIEMDSDGRWKQPVKVLERDYHLSYPFLFQWDGQLYMMPETKRNGTIELYRCKELPLKWEFDRVIMENVQAVDATLHEVGGIWWLFCNIGGRDFSSNDELHLFYAKTPFGPWTPHKLNPVKSDVRSARPAGRLFNRDGNLYRPSQDCSVRMGGAIVMNRIVRLTPDDFKEESVARIDPTWRKGILGTHTINTAGKLTVLDGFTYVPKQLS